ncbi:MAG: hypothetical protein ABI165_05145 [Bryobacteraceae bacterium]
MIGPYWDREYGGQEMDVVEAKIQTVDDIYRVVWTAVSANRPIVAVYHGRGQFLCPHRLGRNTEGQLRVLCLRRQIE